MSQMMEFILKMMDFNTNRPTFGSFPASQQAEISQNPSKIHRKAVENQYKINGKSHRPPRTWRAVSLQWLFLRLWPRRDSNPRSPAITKWSGGCHMKIIIYQGQCTHFNFEKAKPKRPFVLHVMKNDKWQQMIIAIRTWTLMRWLQPSPLRTWQIEANCE